MWHISRIYPGVNLERLRKISNLTVAIVGNLYVSLEYKSRIALRGAEENIWTEKR
jgi:hypothetical protein